MPCDIGSWGPCTWTLLHCGALTYNPTEAKRAAMFQFLTALGSVLPCPRCGEHWDKGLQATRLDSAQSPHLDSAEALFAWTVKMHNRVNAATGKKEIRLQEAIKATLARNASVTLHEKAQSQSMHVFGVGLVAVCLVCCLLYLILRCRAAEQKLRKGLGLSTQCRNTLLNVPMRQ
jgi:hypothetical protein